MNKKVGFQPTAAELEILSALWKRGPSTVKDLTLAYEKDKGWKYTTVLKFLQIMHAKGIVSRKEEGKAHIYESAIPIEQAQASLLKNLVDKAFGGSFKDLMVFATSNENLDADELGEIKKLIEDAEK